MKKVAVVLVVLLVLVLAGLSWLTTRFRNPLPKKGGVTGRVADDAARSLLRRIKFQEWQKMGAIQWKFRRTHLHIWDKKRQFVQVRFGEKRAFKVQLPLQSPEKGVVWKYGAMLGAGKERTRALKLAYAFWANDSFWLNPFAKLFDKGVKRTLFEGKKTRKLLLHFSSGGVTPGDKYLFVIGKDGLPLRFQMWVKILPIPGISFEFGKWTEISGTLLSLDHRLSKWKAIGVTLQDVKGAKTLKALTGKDIFQPLLESLTGKRLARSRRGKTTSQPTSAPTRRAKP